MIMTGRTRSGGVVSRTVTSKLPVAVLPDASLVEQFTVLVPTGNVLPAAGSQTTLTAPSPSSSAVASNGTTAPAGPVASTSVTVLSRGRGSTGAGVAWPGTAPRPATLSGLEMPPPDQSPRLPSPCSRAAGSAPEPSCPGPPRRPGP